MANEYYVRYHGAWVKLLDLYVNGILPPYAPTIWNDSGVYTYFYIDFKQELTPFSVGMFNDSIIIHDSVQILATEVTYVSPGIYKVYCDLNGKTYGITVLNKVTTLLSLITGEPLPTFSIHMDVNGIVAYTRLKYAFDSVNAKDIWLCENIAEDPEVFFWEAIALDEVYESTNIITLITTTQTENASVILR